MSYILERFGTVFAGLLQQNLFTAWMLECADSVGGEKEFRNDEKMASVLKNLNVSG